MYLILAPNDKRILFISETLGRQENGNYLINHETLAIPPSICLLEDVPSIPDGVEPEKWCYVDGEFVPNPNWVEPSSPITDDDLNHFLDIVEGRAN